MRVLKIMALSLAVLLVGVVYASTVVTAVDQPYTLYFGTSIVKPRVDYTSRQACLDAAVANAKAATPAGSSTTRNYSCRTRTNVTVAVSPDTPPPTDPCAGVPKPADKNQTVQCPAGTTGTWTQTQTYTAAAAPTCWTAGPWTPATAPAGACTTTPPPPPPPTTVSMYFTDVVSAPIGGYVTVYKWNGAATVKLAQVPFTGAPVVVDGQTFNISTHVGRVREATTSTLASIVQSVQPGDQIVVRAGTYSAKYDANGWNDSQFVLNAKQSGTAAQPISLTAYPGETVVFKNTSSDRPNFYFGRLAVAERCNYWTISNLTLNAGAMNIDGGGVTSGTSAPESGGTNIRVVGNILQMRALGNVAAGQIELQGDGWKILGNDFQNDYNRSVENQNHAIYIDDGADDTEMAFNTFFDRREGFVMMVHMDGTPMNYTGTWFHHNYVKARKIGDVRGVSHSNVDNSSTMLVEDNVFENVGVSDFGPITVYRGTVTARRNKAVNSGGGAMLTTDTLFGGTRKLIYGTGANANIVQGNSLPMFSGSASDRQAE